MKLLEINPSTRKNKKFMAIFDVNGKKVTTHFGAEGYRDFTLMNNKNSKFYEKSSVERNKVKQSYLKRHAKEDWMKPLSASSLSRWILWNSASLPVSIKNYKRKFNL